MKNARIHTTLALLCACAGGAQAQSCQLDLPIGAQVVLTDRCRGADSTYRTVPIFSAASSSSTLYLSNGNQDPIHGPTPTKAVGGAVGALSVTSAELVPTGSAQVNMQYGLVEEYAGFAESMLVKADITTAVLSWGLDLATGQITHVNTSGGFLLTAPYIRTVQNGGQAGIESLSINLVNGTVTAQASGQARNNTNNNDPTYSDTLVQFSGVLWTFDPAQVTGPTHFRLNGSSSLDLQGLLDEGFTLIDGVRGQYGAMQYTVQGTQEIRGLKLTNDGLDFLSRSLGWGTTDSVARTTWAGVNNFNGWGSISTQVAFKAGELTVLPPLTNIPEPGTYALMGLGLVGLMWAVRRNRSACGA